MKKSTGIEAILATSLEKEPKAGHYSYKLQRRSRKGLLGGGRRCSVLWPARRVTVRWISSEPNG
jgi:hypothetical protein